MKSLDFSESNPECNINNLAIFFKKNTLDYFKKNYWKEIINITLNNQDKVKRWQNIEWIKIEKEQTNKHHIILILHLYSIFSLNTQWLDKIIDELSIIKAIVTHDIWEILTWDYTLDKKESMSKQELIELEKLEEKWAIREILKLKYTQVKKGKIRKIINIYKNYQNKKLQRWNPNENFVKMMDILEALFYMIRYIPELEDKFPYILFNRLKNLEKINSWFIEDYNIDILKDFHIFFKNKENLKFDDIRRFIDKGNYKFIF